MALTDPLHWDTIAAIATPPGVGGVSILRISGKATPQLIRALTGAPPPPPRRAVLRRFADRHGHIIDRGLVLYFPAPHSFTGEDVVELQGHGGPVLMDMLLQSALTHGARLARPGEFSERAFWSGKVDLAQAEALSDLIHAGSERAVRLAFQTLQGELSQRVDGLAQQLLRLRVLCEAHLDFSDAELDDLPAASLAAALAELQQGLHNVQDSAQQGVLLRDGYKVVIAGRPNAGKSSLMNRLAASEVAIVTAIPGTTRDALGAQISIDGMPVHLVDTAGIRTTEDLVEREGIKRTQGHGATADLVLWLFDDGMQESLQIPEEFALPATVPVLWVRNKIDLTGHPPGLETGSGGQTLVAISSQTGAGIDALRAAVQSCAGLRAAEGGELLARRRHLDALQRCAAELEPIAEMLPCLPLALELIAERLRLAHQHLGAITGAVTADAVLGAIFSEFCIGK